MKNNSLRARTFVLWLLGYILGLLCYACVGLLKRAIMELAGVKVYICNVHPYTLSFYYVFYPGKIVRRALIGHLFRLLCPPERIPACAFTVGVLAFLISLGIILFWAVKSPLSFEQRVRLSLILAISPFFTMQWAWDLGRLDLLNWALTLCISAIILHASNIGRKLCIPFIVVLILIHENAVLFHLSCGLDISNIAEECFFSASRVA